MILDETLIEIFKQKLSVEKRLKLIEDNQHLYDAWSLEEREELFRSLRHNKEDEKDK